jgi:sugar lactone lactonase YvrE
MNGNCGQCVLLMVAVAMANAFAPPGRAGNAPVGSGKMETVAILPSSGYTESLCQTPDGSIYVTGIDDRVIWKVSPNGQVEKFASTPAHIMVPLVTKDGFIATARQRTAPHFPATGNFSTAMRVDYSADVGPEILVLDKAGKVTDTIPGPKGAYLNGIADAGHGFYVIADSAGPTVWRLDLAKKRIEPWFKDELLSAPAGASINVAGNGIKVHGGWVYVGVSGREAIYRVRMDSQGRPKGALTLFAKGFRPDDFDITRDGTIYVPNGTSLFRVSPAGEVSNFLDGAGFSAAAMISLDGKWVYWPTRDGRAKPQRLLRAAIP